MNPDLEAAGKETQFGAARGNKRGGDKAWSIRNQIRYAAAQKGIDLSKPEALEQIFGDKPTVAQQIAFKAIQKAMEADMRAIEFADERIDGKLLQPNLNADLNAIQGMNEDELREIIKRANSAAASGLGDAGAPEEI